MKISKEAKVGILALVAITILYVGFRFLKGIDFFDPTNTYYVTYNSVDGLSVSNPVKINGFRVGRVNSITLQQDGEDTKMLVGLEISNDLELYEGSEAILSDDGILGSKSITLEINRRGNVLEDEGFLIGTVDKSLQEMIQERADPIVREVDTTLHRVNNILSGLSGSGEKVDRAVDELRETAQLLKYIVIENRRDINAITSNVQSLTQALNDPESGIKPFMVKLNQMADSLNSLELKETVTNANQAVARLDNIARGLERGEGSLGMLLKDDSLYTNLNRSSKDLDRLLIDVRENPGRYIDFRFNFLGIGNR